jgi:hypothetical protein
MKWYNIGANMTYPRQLQYPAAAALLAARLLPGQTHTNQEEWQNQKNRR